MKRIVVYDRDREIANCTFVKAVLMLLVVFYHSIVFWGGSWFTKNPASQCVIMANVAEWLNSFHIYAFTLTSGYIFSYLVFEKGKYSAFIPFIKNKAKRLLIPYAFVAFIWVIPIQCFFLKYDAFTVFKNFVLAANPNQLWFLIMLFNAFVVFRVLAHFFRKYDLLGLAVVFGMYGCGLVGNAILPNVFMIWKTLQHMLFFWIGFKLRQYGTAILRSIPTVLWLVASVALFAVGKYLDSISGIVFSLLYQGVVFCTKVVGSIMAFVALQRIADTVKRNNKVFVFVSQRSMTVYLFHQQIIYFTIYWLNGIVNPYMNAVVNFIVAMTISLALATVLLRFRATRFLVGEK